MLFQNMFKVFYEANADGGSTGESGSKDETQDNQGEPETLEKWLETQPEDLKAKVGPLLQSHVEKLSNAVKATRRERDDFQKQLTEAMKKAGKGTELETQLQKISDDLDKANRKSEFYESAATVDCRNAKAAYAIALADNLFTRSGAPDWQAIQKEAPELFGKAAPKGPIKKTAGNGTNQEPTSSKSMNDFIRQSAGITQE